MRTLKNRATRFCITGILLMILLQGGAIGALADTTTGSASVISGTLSVSNPQTTVTFYSTLMYSMAFTANDATGMGGGWNLSIQSSTFNNTGGIPRLIIADTSISDLTSRCAKDTTCTYPANNISYPLIIPANNSQSIPTEFYRADVGTGLGKFIIQPTISLSIPTNKADVSETSYTNTTTVAIGSGP